MGVAHTPRRLRYGHAPIRATKPYWQQCRISQGNTIPCLRAFSLLAMSTRPANSLLPSSPADFSCARRLPPLMSRKMPALLPATRGSRPLHMPMPSAKMHWPTTLGYASMPWVATPAFTVRAMPPWAMPLTWIPTEPPPITENSSAPLPQPPTRTKDRHTSSVPSASW